MNISASGPIRASAILVAVCSLGCRVDTDHLSPAPDRPALDAARAGGYGDSAPETLGPVPDASPVHDGAPAVDASADTGSGPSDAGGTSQDFGAPPVDATPSAPENLDCQVSDFGPWSACTKSCGGGDRSRSRLVLTPAMGAGAACPPLTEIEACNVQGCPVDCQVGDWGPWSSCTKSCGGGEESRTRPVTIHPAKGGAACPPLAETRVCNPQPANACGGCGSLPGSPGQDCGACGKFVCAGNERLRCEDPGQTCEDHDAACGTPPDGCGGALDCGRCADALTSCGDAFRCTCGKPTALYSPNGGLEAGRRASSPDGRWYATSDGVFTAADAMVASLVDAKGFDWHPQTPGRFAVMYHFAPPDPSAVIEVVQIADPGLPVPVARGRGDDWHHAMAWVDGERVALGSPAGCTTVRTIRPVP